MKKFYLILFLALMCISETAFSQAGGEEPSDIYSWADYEKWAQGFIHTLSGHISDQDKNPVAGAKVTLQSVRASYEAVTDADGLYAIQAEEEMSPLRVSVAADG